jgi:tRNA-2-methylthio-N6-dimethylallyladenosine synthase
MLKNNLNYLKIDPKYSSTFKANVPISFGCNNFCTYCAVPYTRGREISRTSKEIITECKKLIKNGCKDIILLGQNVNSYGHDNKNELTFPELLKKIDSISGHYWLRYTSPHPKDMSDDLIKVMKEGKHIAHQLNLPVQSGDNEVLRKMGRHYTVSKYLSLVKKIRKAMPDISLSTDVIVGFCGVTKKQFLNTAKLFRTAKFDMAYLAQFSPREGTPAWKMPDDVSKDEKKRREDFLNAILTKTALEYHKQFENKEMEVLIDEIKSKTTFGRNFGWKKISITGVPNKSLGRFGLVKITKAKPFGLEAEWLKFTDK